jgi:hypothetical protein
MPSNKTSSAWFAGGTLARLGVRGSSWWLALGWLGHVAWDVGLHLDRPQAVAPEWYLLLCVGLDLIVAGFLIGRIAPARGTAVS